MNDSASIDHSCPARRRWMAVLARAGTKRLKELLRDWSVPPGYTVLRGPEAGLVMVRGKAGGGGAAFNLGEMTVTRCTVRTASGYVGHAYVTGRDEKRAELAALADALMQDPAHSEDTERHVIAPLERSQGAERTERAQKAAATRVQFFALQTMRT